MAEQNFTAVLNDLSDEELIATILSNGGTELEIMLAERLGRALDAIAAME